MIKIKPPQKSWLFSFTSAVSVDFHSLEALMNGMVRFLCRSRSQVYKRIRPGALGGWEDWIAKQSKKCVGVHEPLVCLYIYMCVYTYIMLYYDLIKSHNFEVDSSRFSDFIF